MHTQSYMHLLHRNHYATPTIIHMQFLTYFFLGGGGQIYVFFNFFLSLNFIGIYFRMSLAIGARAGHEQKMFEVPIITQLQMIYYNSSSLDHTKLLSLLHIFTKQRKPSIPHLKYVYQRGRKTSHSV